MSLELTGKTALVTGGTTGIGFATAQALLAAGAMVIVTGQNPDRVEAAAGRLGPKATGIVADNRSMADIARLAEAVRQRCGSLSILVPNAGVTWAGPLEAVTEDEFDGQFAINLKGNFFIVQNCLPFMKPGSSIVMLASAYDAKGVATMGIYSATKAAIRSLVRTLATELAPRGIRVNSVAPGPIDTPIYEKIGLSPADTEKLRTDEANITLLKRMGAPEEVGRAIAFLASDAASYITGANLRVDGGWTDI